MCLADIAREHDVFDLALAARAQVDHFPDDGNMVCHVMSGHRASGFRCVAQQILSAASQAEAGSVMVG